MSFLLDFSLDDKAWICSDLLPGFVDWIYYPDLLPGFITRICYLRCYLGCYLGL